MLLLSGEGLAQLRELEVKPEDPPSTIPDFRNHLDRAVVVTNSSINNLDITSNMVIVEDLSLVLEVEQKAKQLQIWRKNEETY